MPPAPRKPTKVLRVAVICDELVCDELHQFAPGSVTAGDDIASALLLFGQQVPKRHKLFEWKNGRYFLHVPPHARGKVSLGKRSVTISRLRQKFGSTQHLRVQLNSRAKGKLVFGETTLLFQFSDPAKPTKKLPFPVEYRARMLQQFNSRELGSLAAAALLLGSLFIWAAMQDVELFVTDDPGEWLAKVGYDMPEEEEEAVEEQEEEVLAVEEEEEAVVEEEDEPEDDTKIMNEKPTKFSEKAMKQARGVGIARVLGTYGGPGEGSVFDVIEDTENNLGELFDMGMTQTVMADGGDISPFVPGGTGLNASGSTVETKGFNTDSGPDVKKEKKKERKIRGKVSQTTQDIFGDIDKKAVKATIRRRISALKHCYEKQLRVRPDLSGKHTYTIRISVMGSVTRVTVEQDSLGDAAVKKCTTGKIRGWRFPTQGAEEPAEVTFSVVYSGST